MSDYHSYASFMKTMLLRSIFVVMLEFSNIMMHYSELTEIFILGMAERRGCGRLKLIMLEGGGGEDEIKT